MFSSPVPPKKGPLRLIGFGGRLFKRIGTEPVLISFSEPITTIVGPSGGGKSSLLGCIMFVISSVLQKKRSVGFEESDIESSRQAQCFSVVYVGVNVLERELDPQPIWIGYESRQSESTYTLKIFQKPEDAFSNSRKGFVPDDAMLERAIRALGSVVYVPQDHGYRHGYKYCLPEHIVSKDHWKSKAEVCKKHLNPILRSVCKLEYISEDSFQHLNETIVQSRNLSGGQFDTLLCSIGLCMGDVVILDEPGQNLGAHERSILCAQMHMTSSKKQIVLVTHHVEMLNRTTIPKGLLRFDLPSLGEYYGGKNVVISCLDVDALLSDVQKKLGSKSRTLWMETIRNPLNLGLWFARSLLLVEGDIDKLAFGALSELWHAQGWPTLNLFCITFHAGGKDKVVHLREVLHCLFPHLLLRAFSLLDLDAVYRGASGGHASLVLFRSLAYDLLIPLLLNSRNIYFDDIPLVQIDRNGIGHFQDEIKVYAASISSISDTAMRVFNGFVDQLSLSSKNFCQQETVRTVEEVEAHLQVLNQVLLSEQNFPAFVWPPGFCDIESLIFDKSPSLLNEWNSADKDLLFKEYHKELVICRDMGLLRYYEKRILLINSNKTDEKCEKTKLEKELERVKSEFSDGFSDFDKLKQKIEDPLFGSRVTVIDFQIFNLSADAEDLSHAYFWKDFKTQTSNSSSDSQELLTRRSDAKCNIRGSISQAEGTFKNLERENSVHLSKLCTKYDEILGKIRTRSSGLESDLRSMSKDLSSLYTQQQFLAKFTPDITQFLEQERSLADLEFSKIISVLQRVQMDNSDEQTICNLLLKEKSLSSFQNLVFLLGHIFHPVCGVMLRLYKMQSL
jgi:ABC-type Mn2+/Zn2+ transport system ATPase subunit